MATRPSRSAAAGDRKSYVSAVMYKYIVAVPVGALAVDAAALRETAEALRIAEQVGDDHTLALARLIGELVLVHHGDPHREEGSSCSPKPETRRWRRGSR